MNTEGRYNNNPSHKQQANSGRSAGMRVYTPRGNTSLNGVVSSYLKQGRGIIPFIYLFILHSPIPKQARLRQGRGHHLKEKKGPRRRSVKHAYELHDTTTFLHGHMSTHVNECTPPSNTHPLPHAPL